MKNKKSLHGIRTHDHPRRGFETLCATPQQGFKMNAWRITNFIIKKLKFSSQRSNKTRDFQKKNCIRNSFVHPMPRVLLGRVSISPPTLKFHEIWTIWDLFYIWDINIDTRIPWKFQKIWLTVDETSKIIPLCSRWVTILCLQPKGSKTLSDWMSYIL